MTDPTQIDNGGKYADAEAAVRATMDDWDDATPEGEAAPSEEVQPEAVAEAAPADDEDSEPEPAPVVATADAEKARRAAKLAGLPESVVTRLSDDEAVEWYSSHAKSKADVDRAFRENAEFRREIDALKAAKSAEPAVPAAPEDLELEAILARELGPDVGKQLAARMAARDAQALKPVQALQAALEERLTAAAWADVSQRLGIKEDDGLRARVVQQAEALGRVPGPWSELKGDARVTALFTAAARVLKPDLPSDAELRRRAVREEARRNGSPTAAPQRAAPKVAKTREELEDAVLREIVFKGSRDPDKLRRIGT